MRRDPLLLVFVLGVGVATLALKESKPLARKIGKFLVKAGEEFMKAAEEPAKPPVATVAEPVASEPVSAEPVATETAVAEPVVTEVQEDAGNHTDGHHEG